MDDLNMIIDDLLTIDGVLADVVDVDAEVWQRVRAMVLAAAIPQNPPARAQGLGGEAARFAQHLHKMGCLPLGDSQGMELLLFRWVQAAEEMTCLLRQVVGKQNQNGAAPFVAAAFAPLASIAMDEAYQPSYCDDCGTEIRPDGVCQECVPF